jgi:hypothetical protein
MAVLDADNDNFAAAFDWALARRDARRALELIGARRWFWLRRGRYAEATQRVDAALALPGAEDHALLRARALSLVGWCLWPMGRTAEHDEVFAAAMEAALASGDDVAVSEVLQLYSTRALGAEHLDKAAAYAEEAIARARAARNGWAVARSWAALAVASQTLEDLRARTDEATRLLEEQGNALGIADTLTVAIYSALSMGADEDARAFAERAVPIARDLDERYLTMLLDGNLGLAALFTGDVEAAREAFRGEMTLCRELAVVPFAQESLRGHAAVATIDGDDERAARLLGAAEAHRLDAPFDPVLERLAATFFEPARARLGAGAWDAAAREGAALSTAEAIAYALGERGA